MSTHSHIGTVLEGKYEIIDLLGKGGMGSVYKARHRLIKRTMAVKLLHKEYTNDADIVARFQLEARASAAIGHDHIVDITDMGVTDNGELFIAMEMLEGCNLAQLISKEKTLSPKRACHIMIQVLSALEAAHDKGIVHRDLKPANIFLTSQQRVEDYVKLVDFGISKMRSSDDTMAKGLTRTGELLGTPSYMSPEQAQGKTGITHASDIYSAGTILYEMLTGSRPFMDKAIPPLLVKILRDEPENPRISTPDLPIFLADVISRAMKKAPQDRFKDAASFRRAITEFSPETASTTGLATTRFSEQAAEIVEGFARNSHGSLGSTKTAAATPLSVASTSVPKTKRSQLPIIAGISCAAAVLVAIALLTTLRLSDNKAPSSPAVVPLLTTPSKIKKAVKNSPADHVPQPSVVPKKAASQPILSQLESVLFSVKVQPAHAVISLDGNKLGNGTIKLEMPRDQKEHDIVILAPGYETHRSKIVFEESVLLEVNLNRTVKATTRNRNRRPPLQEKQEVVQEKPAEPTTEPVAKPEIQDDSRRIDESTPW